MEASVNETLERANGESIANQSSMQDIELSKDPFYKEKKKSENKTHMSSLVKNIKEAANRYENSKRTNQPAMKKLI